MQIDISSLKENKGKSLNFRIEKNLSPLELGGETIDFDGPVLVEGTATNVETGILAHFTVKAGILVDCDRCLQPVNIDMEMTVTENFLEEKHYRVLTDKDEQEFHAYTGNLLDISKIVEENILLGVPMKILCAVECKGICSFCGNDLNTKECNCCEQDVDPRMEKLKGWFNEQ